MRASHRRFAGLSSLVAAALLLPSCRTAPTALAPPEPEAILAGGPLPAPAQITDELPHPPAIYSQVAAGPEIELCAAQEPAAPSGERIARLPQRAGCATCAPKAAAPCASCGGSGGPCNDCLDRPRNPNEWLCDGDDAPPDVRLTADGRVQGLDSEDTVAIWDHEDGSTEIVASNRVCIYAPRFAAVRKVITPYEGAGVDGSQPLVRPEGPARLDLLAEPATRASKDELFSERLARKAGGLESLAIDGQLSSRLNPEGFSDAFLPFENLLLLRTGRAQADEAARLAEGLDAAREWTSDQAVQVVLDGVAAVELEGDRKVQVVFTSEPQGEAKLRVWKVASTDSAQPGDVVDFTIRFDNIGTRPVQRVTLMDRLTTRLEFVEGSAQASRSAQFSTEVVDGQTVLHWDFDDSLPAGQGGLVRFKCRVQ